MNLLDLYFDRKHILNVNDYPHFLISGSTGSGKSYFANELVIQAIIKGWQVALDRITILRVPMITDMENFKEVVDCGAVG